MVVHGGELGAQRRRGVGRIRHPHAYSNSERSLLQPVPAAGRINSLGPPDHANLGSDAQPSPEQCNLGCNLHPNSAAFTRTGQPLSRPVEDCGGRPALAGIREVCRTIPVQVVQIHLAFSSTSITVSSGCSPWRVRSSVISRVQAPSMNLIQRLHPAVAVDHPDRYRGHLPTTRSRSCRTRFRRCACFRQSVGTQTFRGTC